MQSRGLSLTQVGAAAAAYTVTVALLELPTGSLADAVGRRTVLVAGTLFSLAKLAVFLTAQSVTMFMVAWVLHGVDRALRSGPLEAWFVDTDLGVNRGRDMGRGLSRAGVAESLALGGSALVAGLLPRLLPNLAHAGDRAVLTVLTMPVVAAILLELVHLAALVRLLPRQPRQGGLGSLARDALATPATAVRGLRLLWSSAEIRLLLSAAAAVGSH
jgi:DHA1 family tetracycline resistance protein-like MFS transporter